MIIGQAPFKFCPNWFSDIGTLSCRPRVKSQNAEKHYINCNCIVGCIIINVNNEWKSEHKPVDGLLNSTAVGLPVVWTPGKVAR